MPKAASDLTFDGVNSHGNCEESPGQKGRSRQESCSTRCQEAAVKRAPNAAFLKPLTPSAALAAVIGAAPLPRTEVTKKVWEYIKKHNLQDAANKRNINADDKLKVIFKKPQVTMFELTKLISDQLS